MDQISLPGGDNANEDLIASWHKDGITDIVILDGGTSVADRAYVDEVNGDAAWMVGQFARALEVHAAPGRAQDASLILALKDVHAAFLERTQGIDVPLHAWPVGAMSWVRIREDRKLGAYCIGDCELLLRHADGRIEHLNYWVNPQEAVLRDAVAQLTAAGITDGAERKKALLPMLRARREWMNTTDVPPALCIAPGGTFVARSAALQIESGAMLLGMTDGFYRLVENYGLYTDDGLFDLCSRGGLAEAGRILRAHENALASGAALAVKNADDASAFSFQF
ncbi:hypothetical protein [Pseudoduganella rhizocola]|uniref:hypothetical protein n=1 Tax=Pseudoduganella rhizocola TaxID=3382643 RepID=UPI0038B4BCC9